MDYEQADRLLEDPIFELIPMKHALEKASELPERARVSVTASPDKGMRPTVDLALDLAERGFAVTPHISARATATKSELAHMVSRFAEAGIDQAFVVGGDAVGHGDFRNALELLVALDGMGHPFTRIGVAGYPEGHPNIPDDRLLSALVAKLPHASYIATQMCFDAAVIEAWIRSIRSAGVDLPVSLGVPGAVDAARLLTIGARIGVGRSLRYVRKNRKGIARMMRTGSAPTDDLVMKLAPLAEQLGIDGLHIFTFNAVADTTAWWQSRRSAR